MISFKILVHGQKAKMQKIPYISLIMTVKNGMPFLPYALESVATLDFSDFELIIQDGQSTDGSIQIFDRYRRDPRLSDKLHFVSERDVSLADAKERAFRRCRGTIVGSIDADNLLISSSLTLVANTFRSNPDLAALYGSQKMINVEGNPLSTFHPQPFNLIDHLECRLVPPFGASFFNRSLVGEAILPAPDLLYCADFELWLKISHLRIESTGEYLSCTRVSQNSITCRPESYAQMCQDKLVAIRRYFENMPQNRLHVDLRRRCEAGVFVWAAESVKYNFPTADAEIYFLEFLRGAVQADAQSPRVKELMQRCGLA